MLPNASLGPTFRVSCHNVSLQGGRCWGKIWKYVLYESSEGLFCAHRKPANFCHPGKRYVGIVEEENIKVTQRKAGAGWVGESLIDSCLLYSLSTKVLRTTALICDDDPSLPLRGLSIAWQAARTTDHTTCGRPSSTSLDFDMTIFRKATKGAAD